MLNTSPATQSKSLVQPSQFQAPNRPLWRWLARGLSITGLAIALFGAAALQAPAQEFRAAWVNVFSSVMSSQGGIDTMLSTLASGNYNAVIIQVVGYMDYNGTGSHGAQYRSNILPRSPRVTSGFDPLAYLCTQAHAAGIEVHAWLGGSGGAMYRVSLAWPFDGNSELSSHPEWFIAPRANSEGGTPVLVDGYCTLDMGSPDVQNYLVRIVRELVTNYPIDGIHWDDEINGAGYTAGFGYPAVSTSTYTNSGLARYRRITGNGGTPAYNDSTWSDYRRRYKEELIARCQAEIQTIKSNPRQPLRHSSSTMAFGGPPGTCTFTSEEAYTYFSNWPKMLDRGWLDTAIPMTYSDTYFYSWADRIAACWVSVRPVFMGISASLSNPTIKNEIDYLRSKGLKGYATYSYDTASPDWWSYAAANVNTSVVDTPSMPWRSPATATEGIMWGFVTNASTGFPVDDATVTVAGALYTAQTDANGCYVVTLVPAGSLGVVRTTTVTKTGMTSQSISAVAVAGDITRWDLKLNPVVGFAPSLVIQPVSQTVNQGNNASFRVAAGGSTPLSYQWRLYGTNISGATSSIYTRSSVQPADAGPYSVVVTNTAGSATSSNAVLTVNVIVTQPGIVTQPADQMAIAGQSATFSVTATGGALNYQWSFNDVPIDGATDSTYTRNNVQLADAGSYSVVITNSVGSTNSADAVLAVNCLLAATATGGGTVSKSPDLVSYSANAVVTLTATTNTGYVFTGWSGDATGTDNPLSVTMTTNKSITANFGGTGPDITIDNTDPGWSNTSPSGSWTAGSSASMPKIGANYLYAVSSRSSSITRSCRWTPELAVAGLYDVYVYYQLDSYRTTNANYRVIYDGGSVSSPQNQYSAAPNQGGWFQVGTNLPFASGNAGYVELGNDSLDTALVSADAARFVFITAINVAPSISQQPTNQNVNLGGSATFTVTASGTPAPAYQWRRNGGDISGATDSSYTRNNVQPADAGSYSVVVSNIVDTVTSDDAVLTVTLPPPPQIEAITLTTGDQIQLQVNCAAGHWAVDATTNLMTLDWVELTNFTTIGGTTQCFDSATSQIHRFYRVRLIP